jgi:anti-sigma regulatory factor (Ser/Thr protein kinase)
MFYSETLPKSAGSAGKARRVLDRLEGRMDPEALANARLLVSELIANVVEHVQGESGIGVRMDMNDGVLRVEVRDAGPGFVVQPRRPDHPQESGWGLHFLRMLADRWAVENEHGARVWFEIKTGAQAAEA